MPIKIADATNFEMNDDGSYIVWETSRFEFVTRHKTWPNCEARFDYDGNIKHFNPMAIIGDIKGLDGGHFTREKALAMIHELYEKESRSK